MSQDQASFTPKTYKLKNAIFEIRKQEEFLTLMNNFKTVIDGTGTTSVPRRIKHLRTILCGENLQ